MSISKEWFTWGDCYQLDIADSADETLALAVVLGNRRSARAGERGSGST